MSMELRIVCPENCAFDGNCGFVVVPSTTGELGILPAHSPEIATTQRGYVRIFNSIGDEPSHVIAVESGYVQVADDKVLVLVERALDMAEVKHEEVQTDLQVFEERLQELEEDDARRAYIYNEIAWCNLLLNSDHTV